MSQIPVEFIEKSIQQTKNSNKIVILSHKNPDGDALGSGLALVQFFKEIGKEPKFILPNEMPVYLNWMPNASEIVTYTSHTEQATELVNQAELIIMVDFNHRSRLDKLAEVVLAAKCPKIMIDHHPYPEQLADNLYSRVSASSTAEMVFEFLTNLNDHNDLSKPVAECLFVGIMTDTGNLSYNSSKPFTFKVVSELLKSGIDKDDITDKVYNNYSQYRLRLLGHALNQRMKVIPEYKTAFIYLSRRDLDNYHFEQGDTEGFVNYPLSIKGIVFSAIFIEKDGYTKCSFRSKGSFPANLVSSEHFNGGGHRNAAGGEHKGILPTATAKFEEILPQYKSYLDVD